MNKAAYLGDPDVASFLAWLRNNLAALPVRVGATQGAWTGPGQFRLAHHNYSWSGANWLDTFKMLTTLSDTLRAAIRASDQVVAEKACIDILDWGRVPRSGIRVRQLAVGLTGYLTICQATLALASANTALLAPIQDASSGWTKIYALASNDDLPIYDSRIGAAMAGLVAIFLKSKAKSILPSTLDFPVGNHRAGRVRRPQDMSGGMYPRFSLLIGSKPKGWASAQIRTGWIVQELVHPSSRQVPIWPGATMRDVEAGLFVVGYDLRSIL